MIQDGQAGLSRTLGETRTPLGSRAGGFVSVWPVDAGIQPTVVVSSSTAVEDPPGSGS